MPQATLTIDATASSGVDFSTYFTSYFAEVAAANGTSSFHGGTPDGANGMYGYLNGDQVSFKYRDAGSTGTDPYTHVTVLGGNDLSYDALHYDAGYPHGYISGSVDSISFGTIGAGETEPTAGASAYTDFTAELVISGLDLYAPPGTGGSTSTDPVPLLYYALRGGYLPANVTKIEGVLDAYAQNFLGSSGADSFTGGQFNDSFTGRGSDDSFDGGGGIDRAIFDGTSSSFTITAGQDGSWTVSGASGTDTLTDVEYAVFSDQRWDFRTGQFVALNVPPTDIALAGSTVAENSAAGTVVGTLSAYEPDGDEFTFGLTGASANLFEIVGNELRVLGALDFEASSTRSVTVVATDSGGESSSQTFTINLTDVDEAPHSVKLFKGSVAENSAIGTTVGTLAATDPEMGTLTYTLTDDAGGLFKITGNKLQLAKTVNYEAIQSEKVTVEVADAGGQKATETFTIKILDMMETTVGKGKSETLTGDRGADKILGNGGADRLWGKGGNDRLEGGDGRDKLWGGSGNDKLYGGNGNDRLHGGLGADDLHGGKGADTFHFNLTNSTVASSGRDTIFDFSAKQGDLIDLSDIDADFGHKGNQHFDFIGKHAFSGEAGELRFVKKASDTYVYADLDGDKHADFAIHLDDAISLHKGDFLL